MYYAAKNNITQTRYICLFPNLFDLKLKTRVMAKSDRLFFGKLSRAGLASFF